MNNVELKKVYAESLVFVRVNSYFQLAIASMLVIGGMLMSLFLVLFAEVPAIVGILVMLICTGIAVFNGWKGYVDLKGNPIVIHGEILKKELFTASESPESTREYYLHLNIDEAYSVDSEGKTTALPKLKGKHRFSASNKVWINVNEHETVEMILTPSRMVVTQLGQGNLGVER
jgi:hypothetical protein